MEDSTPLDYVEFRLSPSRTRCELFVVARSTATEKLASGLLRPFLAHLRAAEEQFDSGSPVIRLELTSKERDANTAWFTKGTLERFVRFVSTPEVLLRVKTLEDELSQLDEVRKFQESSLAENQCEDQCLSGDVIISTSDDEGSSQHREARFMSRRLPYEMIDSKAEASKRELLRAMEVRLLAMQQEQNVAFTRAATAGFDGENMVDLIAFAKYFGADRLREACLQFITLCEKKKVKKIVRSESHSTVTEVGSSGSDMSLASNDGVDPGSDHEVNSYYKRTNGRKTSTSSEAVNFSTRIKKSTMDVSNKEPRTSREREVAGTESSFSGQKFPSVVNNRDESKDHNQKLNESFKEGMPRPMEAQNESSSQPTLFERNGQSSREGTTNPKEDMAASSLPLFPTSELKNKISDTHQVQVLSSPKEIRSNGGGVAPVKRLSVQAAISLFESKQKSDAIDAAKKLGRQDSGGPAKSVLRRWSGAHELMIDAKNDSSSGIQSEKGNSDDLELENIAAIESKTRRENESKTMRENESVQNSELIACEEEEDSCEGKRRAAVLEKKRRFERLLLSSSATTRNQAMERVEISQSKPINGQAMKESFKAEHKEEEKEDEKTLESRSAGINACQKLQRYAHINEQEKGKISDSNGHEINMKSSSGVRVFDRSDEQLESESFVKNASKCPSPIIGTLSSSGQFRKGSIGDLSEPSARVKASSDRNGQTEEINEANTRNGEWQKQFKLKLERTLSREPITNPETPPPRKNPDLSGTESRSRSLVRESLEKLTRRSFPQIPDDESGKITTAATTTTSSQKLSEQDDSQARPSILKQGFSKGIPPPPLPPPKPNGIRIRVNTNQSDQKPPSLCGIANTPFNSSSSVKQSPHLKECENSETSESKTIRDLPEFFNRTEVDANPSKKISSYLQEAKSTISSSFSGNQGAKEAEIANSPSEKLKRRSCGNSTGSIDANSSRMKSEHNVIEEPSLESNRGVLFDNNMQVLANMLGQQKLGLKDDSCTEGQGRFYEQYAKLRDTKLRNEKPAKRAERQAKLKALEQTLDTRKTEMEVQSTKLVRRNKSSVKPRSRPEKSRMLKNATMVSTRKEKEEEEEERMDLKENRQEWGGIYSSSSSLSSLPRSSNEQFPSIKSRGVKKSTPSRNSPAHTVGHQSKPTPRNPTGCSPIQRRSGASNLSNTADTNPLDRSVVSFSDLKKESAKPLSGRLPGSNNVHSKSFSSRSRNEGSSSEINGNGGTTKSSSMTKRALPSRKSCATVAELKGLSSEEREEMSLPMPKAEDDGGVIESAFHSKAKRTVIVSLPDAKPFLCNGEGIDAKHPDEDDGLSYSEIYDSDALKQDGFQALDQMSDVILDGSIQVLQKEEKDSLNHSATIEPTDNDRFEGNEMDSEVFDVSYNLESSKSSICEETLPKVSHYNEEGIVLSQLHAKDLGQDDVCLSVTSSFRAVSPPSSFLRPAAFSNFPSPSVAALDSPLDSPASWNSSQNAFASEADLIRARRKWGLSQKTSSLPFKEPVKGFKRFLKFGRKSRPSETMSTDWISASTISDGDDDVEEVKDYGSQSTDDLLRRVRTLGATADLESFNSGDPSGIQHQGTIPSIRTSIPGPPANFKLREDHLSGGASLKGTRSFFSLSSFRSKGNERKEVIKS